MELTLLIDSSIKLMEYIWLLIRYIIVLSCQVNERKDDPLITAYILAMLSLITDANIHMYQMT